MYDTTRKPSPKSAALREHNPSPAGCPSVARSEKSGQHLHPHCDHPQSIYHPGVVVRGGVQAQGTERTSHLYFTTGVTHSRERRNHKQVERF